MYFSLSIFLRFLLRGCIFYLLLSVRERSWSIFIKILVGPLIVGLAYELANRPCFYRAGAGRGSRWGRLRVEGTDERVSDR